MSRTFSNKVEETWNRINTHKGVEGIIIVNKRGTAIKSTMDQNKTIEYGSLVNTFKEKCVNAIGHIHPDEEVHFIRIRSKKNEIMIAPDGEYSLIVVQNPSEDQ